MRGAATPMAARSSVHVGPVPVSSTMRATATAAAVAVPGGDHCHVGGFLNPAGPPRCLVGHESGDGGRGRGHPTPHQVQPRGALVGVVVGYGVQYEFGYGRRGDLAACCA